MGDKRDVLGVKVSFMSSIGENYPQFWLFSQWVILSGECAISMVLSFRSKDLKQWTNVTALLQFSFIWQVKDSTSLRHEGRWTQKGRLNSGSSFYMFCLLPMNLPYVNWDSQEGCFTWGSHSSPRIFFCSIFLASSFLCLLATPFWTLFSYSNYLTILHNLSFNISKR